MDNLWALIIAVLALGFIGGFACVDFMEGQLNARSSSD